MSIYICSRMYQSIATDCRMFRPRRPLSTAYKVNVVTAVDIAYVHASLTHRGAGMDAAGLSAVRPLHRAAVEGLVTILGTLLDRGASPHELDSNL